MMAVLFVLPACSKSAATKAPGKREPGKAVVLVRTLVPQDLVQSIDTVGNLLADEEVVVTSEIAGRVQSIGFTEGGAVKKGDVLLRLDDLEWKAELDRAKAELELATVEERRAAELLKRQGIAQASYDEAVAKRGVAQAQKELAAARLAKTVIEAPFDGLVGLRQISEGSLIAPGDRVVTLQRLDPIKLQFSIPEEYASYVSTGNLVHFSAPGLTGERTANIYSIEPRVDATTRTVAIRATLPNPEHLLMPGGYATVRVPLETIRQGLLVPALALIPGRSMNAVYVVREGVARLIKIETGPRTRDGIVATKGLQPGDELVISGVQQLRDGLEVDARPEATPTPAT